MVETALGIWCADASVAEVAAGIGSRLAERSGPGRGTISDSQGNRRVKDLGVDLSDSGGLAELVWEVEAADELLSVGFMFEGPSGAEYGWFLEVAGAGHLDGHSRRQRGPLHLWGQARGFVGKPAFPGARRVMRDDYLDLLLRVVGADGLGASAGASGAGVEMAMMSVEQVWGPPTQSWMVFHPTINGFVDDFERTDLGISEGWFGGAIPTLDRSAGEQGPVPADGAETMAWVEAGITSGTVSALRTMDADEVALQLLDAVEETPGVGLVDVSPAGMVLVVDELGTDEHLGEAYKRWLEIEFG